MTGELDRFACAGDERHPLGFGGSASVRYGSGGKSHGGGVRSPGFEFRHDRGEDGARQIPVLPIAQRGQRQRVEIAGVGRGELPHERCDRHVGEREPRRDEVAMCLQTRVERREDVGGGGDAGRAMTESQAREAVQVLRRVRNMIASANEENLTLGTICIRFEAMLDVHVARSKGTSSVWRGDGLPDAHPKAIALDRRDEAYRRFEAAKRLEEAERLEAAGRHGGAECFEAAARRLEEAKAATRLEFDNWQRLDLLRLPR